LDLLQLSDGKSIETDRSRCAVIQKLQYINGNAIRDNSDSPDNMKRAVWAAYFQRLSTEISPAHIVFTRPRIVPVSQSRGHRYSVSININILSHQVLWRL